MKTLNDYMEMSYRLELVEDKEEGGYVASYPDLPGCIKREGREQGMARSRAGRRDRDIRAG